MSEKYCGGPNFEEYVVCPYDKVHRIMPTRLAYHLTRCAKNFPSSKMVRCPFNTTHLHSVTNMQLHVIDCPDRAALERYKLPDSMPPAEPRPCEFNIACSEDWDAEPPAPTYDPKKYCETELVIRNPQGAPPAARRQFRERERRRFLESQRF
ncbi:gametocyte-specific factor 1 homolog [Drosophila ficusphila]|uniref:gametocyte-specific factor 1 homolog n=1 Tax=Drosophila ficusphila TaxID=30025 RepID=UPI0007E633DA|nr:gametocyte-specific factor 1 homolog [Drosophila ficusphila]